MIVRLGELGVALLLLDIEGTTTPVSFVYDVLFPYARARVDAWLAANEKSAEYSDVMAALRDEIVRDRPEGIPVPGHGEALTRENAVLFVGWLMDRDVKSPGLKKLQGFIWRDGYADGSLVGEVFDDVPAALERWTAAGIRVAIYSSGSVLAQKLIFGHTRYGDLTRSIEAYFDTSSGSKREPDSYARIAASVGLDASRIAFISDSVAELDAAAAAGMLDILAVRPGNQPPGTRVIERAVHTFHELKA